MTALPDQLLQAVADVISDETKSRAAADRELRFDIVRLRERIDEYGNVIETKFLALSHQMRDLITDAVAQLDVRDGEPGPAGPPGTPGPAGDAGPRGEAGPPGAEAYPGQARGLYQPDGVYLAMDVVSMNGCEWRAVKDEPGPLPGDGWMLGAKQGRKGDKGEPGRPGPTGPAGAAGVDAIMVRDWSLVLAFNDGTQLTCNLFPLFERYHREAA
jgi:hypothetical protein